MSVVNKSQMFAARRRANILGRWVWKKLYEAQEREMQGANLPLRLPGEDAETYLKRVRAWLTSDTARSKADDREWTGSPPFHLDRFGDR